MDLKADSKSLSVSQTTSFAGFFQNLAGKFDQAFALFGQTLSSGGIV